MNQGNAGRVAIHAGDFAIAGGGFVSAGVCNCASGNGGTVVVNVDGTLSIDGNSRPTPGLTSADIGPGPFLPTGIGVASSHGSVGNAGSITVNARALNIFANGVILSSTVSGSEGNGGDVFINAGRLTVDGSVANAGPDFFPTGISAETCCTGHAGRVAVNAGSLSILNGGVISGRTAGSGNGGDVRVNADVINLSGTGPQITALSTGSGNAGALEVAASRLSLFDGASISTAAASANGGNIALSVGDRLYLRQSAITTSVGGAFGNGGNITIDPQLVVLDRSQIIAQAVQGHGGDILIAAGEFIPSATSLVSASSQLGISGTVEITGPRTDLNGSLVVLSSELRGNPLVARDNCDAGNRLRSSLVEAGRGGLPLDSRTMLPTLYLAGLDDPPAPRAAALLAPRLPLPAAARAPPRGCV
jgi:large exoprotein involved in heme utilization and adhesion